MQTNRKASK